MDRVLYPEFVEPSDSESFAWEADTDTSDILAQTRNTNALYIQ